MERSGRNAHRDRWSFRATRGTRTARCSTTRCSRRTRPPSPTAPPRSTCSVVSPMPGTTGSNWPLARAATVMAGTRRARDWSSTSRRSTRWRSSPGMQFATVGAGAQLIDVYNQLGASGVLLPGGSCPTVGIAGLALGGGIGVFGAGLRVDLRQHRLAEHRDRRRLAAPMLAQRPQRPVLGQSGWGRRQLRRRDVLHLHRPPHPQRDAVHAGVALGRGGDRPRFAWLRWIPSAPDELWSNCQLASNGAAGGGTSLKVTGVFAGSTSGLHERPGPLLECRRRGPDLSRSSGRRTTSGPC